MGRKIIMKFLIKNNIKIIGLNPETRQEIPRGFTTRAYRICEGHGE